MPAWNAQRASTRGPPSRKGSLSIEDTFESITELGPLELMGRELDLAPYGTLRKSQSADSLNSISSVSNTFGQDFTLGQVEVSMDYDAASHTLHVAVLQGKDLLEREEASFESCFMRVSLLPDEQIVGISRVSGGWGRGRRRERGQRGRWGRREAGTDVEAGQRGRRGRGGGGAEGGAGQRGRRGRGVPRALRSPAQAAGVQGQAASEEDARERVWMLMERKVLSLRSTEPGVWGLRLQPPVVPGHNSPTT